MGGADDEGEVVAVQKVLGRREERGMRLDFVESGMDCWGSLRRWKGIGDVHCFGETSSLTGNAANDHHFRSPML